MKFSQRKMPQFCMKLFLVLGIGWTALLLLQDAAQVFGWKRVFEVIKSLNERMPNARKKT